MELSWISPLYLSGLLLLALPVLIHLVQKQSRSGLKFPSLMFLKKIPYQEKRRLKIRNWWLLILRCLLLLLIVMAFARPFLTAAENPLLNLERKDSVIVIDKSYSMRIADQWRQAQAIALKLLDQQNALDRVAVIVFDDKAEVLSDFTVEFDRLGKLIRGQQAGFRITRLAAAIEQAARLLNASDANRKQIFLISDFQASAASAGGIPAIARDITLKTFAVSHAEVSNSTISSFSMGPSSPGFRDQHRLNLTLTNHSAKAVDQQIKLHLNGRKVHRQDLRLESGSVLAHSIDQLSASGELMRGVISLSDDALELDNRAYFVLSGKQALPVLILEASRPRVNQSLYLESALGLSRNPMFRVSRLSSSRLKAEELSNWAVIIINDAPIPGGALGEALLKFVTAGGGLLIAAGDAVQGNWPSGDDGLLPGTLLSSVVSKQGMTYNMTELDRNHPLSSMLDGQDDPGLSQARVYSYRNLRPNDGDRVIGRYDDGAVALLERRVGQGRVLVLTTTLDTQWNDLALQPIFLPFLHHSLRYLAAVEPQPTRFEVGSVVDVMRYARSFAGGDAIVAADDDTDLIIELPSSEEVRLNRQSPLLTIEQPGFYQIHRATPATVEVTLAANVNPLEANLMPLDLQRFEEEIRNSAQAVPPRVVLTQRQAGEREQQQQLWRLILSAVLVLILIEALSANWISRQASI